MIAPIYIDLSETIDEFSLSKNEVDSLSKYVLSRVVEDFKSEWERLIGENLHQTKGEYMKAIFEEYPDDHSVILGLTPRESRLALMIEDGSSSFDMKEGFKSSDKAKNKGTNRWYLTIPFRMATSEAVAESAIFSQKMPKQIEKVVKKLDKPMGLADIPKEFRGLGSNPTTKYEHKFNIYEGLQRKDISSTNKEKRGGYFTFRRVSENSDADSWVHKGFEAKKLMDRAMNAIDIGNIVDKATDEFLNKNL